LSITTHPVAVAIGAYFAEISPPAENKPICTFEKSKASKSSTSQDLPWQLKLFQAERFEAKGYKLLIGKFLSSKIEIRTSPTAPVAPTIATSYFLLIFIENV